MDQIHEELKQAVVVARSVQQDEEAEGAGVEGSVAGGADVMGPAVSGAGVHGQDNPYTGSNDSSPSPPPHRHSDTDYETCDSGMSSERSSIDNAALDESADSNRRRKPGGEKGRADTDSGVITDAGAAESAKDRKDTANKAQALHRRASSLDITAGGAGQPFDWLLRSLC